MIQFLRELHEQGLLAFNFVTMSWAWDIEEISSTMGATENVAEYLREKMLKQSLEIQFVMRVAACLGRRFDVDTLERLVDDLNDFEPNSRSYQVLNIVEECIDEGFLIRSGKSVSFVPDQIQDVALRVGENTQTLQARVGLILLSAGEKSAGEKLFLAVDMCNAALSILNSDELLRLANHNLSAGDSAMQKGAFSSALVYFQFGIECLGTTCWSEHNKLAFDLTRGQQMLPIAVATLNAWKSTLKPFCRKPCLWKLRWTHI